MLRASSISECRQRNSKKLDSSWWGSWETKITGNKYSKFGKFICEAERDWAATNTNENRWDVIGTGSIKDWTQVFAEMWIWAARDFWQFSTKPMMNTLIN